MAFRPKSLVAFMTWEGYNYEDANSIMRWKRLVKMMSTTSIIFERNNESEAVTQNLGLKKFTRLNFQTLEGKSIKRFRLENVFISYLVLKCAGLGDLLVLV